MRRRAIFVPALLGLLSFPAFGNEASTPIRPPGKIVYSSNALLFVARADGSGERRVTDGPKDFSPRWSPDGRRIVFTRSVTPGLTAIWIVNADGSDPRPLDDVHQHAEHPRWSPNGRWIAYQVQTSTYLQTGLRAHTTFELWLVRPDGSKRHRLMRGDGGVTNDNPLYSVASGAWAWSPDGRRIAAITGGEGSERVQVIDVTTGRVHGRGRAADVSWSPDGRRLAVAVDTSFEIAAPGCGPILIVPRDRGKRRRVTRPRNDDPAGVNNACDMWPRWSTDGRSLVVVRSVSEGGPRRLLAVGTDGAHLQRVRSLALARYHWPARCGKLLEYASGYGSGWIVRSSATSAPRFVQFPVGGRTVCDPDSADPCEAAGDWRCS
jgi:Tol biopolymer transport system component